MVNPNQNQLPLPGMEPTPPPVPVVATEALASQTGPMRSTDIEDRVSEAGLEQGWGQQRGALVGTEDRPARTPEAIAAQKAADEKRRKRRSRVTEGPATDVHSDDIDPVTIEALVAADTTADPIKPEDRLTGPEAILLMRRQNAGLAVVRMMQENSGDLPPLLARTTAYADKHPLTPKNKPYTGV